MVVNLVDFCCRCHGGGLSEDCKGFRFSGGYHGCGPSSDSDSHSSRYEGVFGDNLG